MIKSMMTLVGIIGLLFVVGCSPVEQQSVVEATAQTTAPSANQDVYGKPDLNGIWQAMGSSHYDLEAHAARMGPIVAMGALGAIPAGQSVVVGGKIPYQEWARTQQQANLAQWHEKDPAVKCFMPGIPRATYMPFPFQIIQGSDTIIFAYEFASASRIVYMNKPDFEHPFEAWMGHSRGHWEGDTLVIDVASNVPDTWFDSSGNFHSEALRVTERYTRVSENVLNYEATIEDPNVFTESWTIKMPLYRRLEENAQLLEFKCVEFAEELMYGHLVKKAAQ
jgi:hypothetical protein